MSVRREVIEWVSASARLLPSNYVILISNSSRINDGLLEEGWIYVEGETNEKQREIKDQL